MEAPTSPVTLDTQGLKVLVTAKPLEREVFAPFGDVIENPRPDVHPSAAAPGNRSRVLRTLPYQAVSANQGSALKYQHVSRMRNLYDQAPSGSRGEAVMNMFVCAARKLQTDGAFPVSILERHPFTTQTFVPVTPDPNRQYLVIVAPSLPPVEADQCLPVPTRPELQGLKQYPGRGLPDLGRLHAFVASAGQAVTYGAGVWHAPMVALGPPASAVDFVVVQFANGVAIEDCQEVVFGSSHAATSVTAGSLVVRVPPRQRSSKL